MEALSIDEFVLFGHSVGGAMAVIAAGLFPKQCRGVITESSQAFVEERTLEGIKKAKAEFEDPKIFSRLEKYHGDKDEYGCTGFPELICEFAGGKSKKLILQKCGHIPHREFPDLILNAVKKFLQNL